MFGIGKVLQQVLAEHNLADRIGELSTESMASLRQSLEALNESGAITDIGKLLDDLSGNLQGSLEKVAEEAGHLTEEPEADPSSPLSNAIGEVGATLRDAAVTVGDGASAAAAALGAQAAVEAEETPVPAEMETLPHDSIHTLQGVAVEDDGVIDTEADAPPEAVTVEAAHAEESGETSDD